MCFVRLWGGEEGVFVGVLPGARTIIRIQRIHCDRRHYVTAVTRRRSVGPMSRMRSRPPRRRPIPARFFAMPQPEPGLRLSAVLALALVGGLATPNGNYDVLVRGGTVYDGTGSPRRPAE